MHQSRQQEYRRVGEMSDQVAGTETGQHSAHRAAAALTQFIQKSIRLEGLQNVCDPLSNQQGGYHAGY